MPEVCARLTLLLAWELALTSPPSVFRSETSEKALTAINNLNLTPFLLSFLTSRAALPISLVTAAGE